MAFSGGFLLIDSGAATSPILKIFNDTAQVCDADDALTYHDILQRSEAVTMAENTVRVLTTDTALVEIPAELGVRIIDEVGVIIIKKEGISVTVFRVTPRSFSMGRMMGRGSARDSRGRGWLIR